MNNKKMFLSTGLLIILLIIILFMFGIVTISFSDNGTSVNNENSRNKNNVAEGFYDSKNETIGIVVGSLILAFVLAIVAVKNIKVY